MKKQHKHVAVWVGISLGLMAYASSVEDDTPAAATPASSSISSTEPAASELYESAYDNAIATAEEFLARGWDQAGFAASGGEICDGIAAEIATMYDFTEAEQYEYMRGCIDGLLSVADR